MTVAGFGCRRGCSEQALRELLERTLQSQGLPLQALDALASIDLKQTEPGLLGLARSLGLPLVCFSAEQLARFEPLLSRRSAIALRETGCAGVAEASALAQAEALGGRPATLLMEKLSSAEASLALAHCAAEPR
ncbi:MAG: cobalamin biosynthesis protein [Pseudomonas sp.]|uniref:cobalamin biosynthesis protein n=1 Tax=Pseudomonas sp. TaxID=306 RepID=UPI0033927B52